MSGRRGRAWLVAAVTATPIVVSIVVLDSRIRRHTEPRHEAAIDLAAARILDSDRLTHDQQRTAIEALVVVLGELREAREGGAE